MAPFDAWENFYIIVGSSAGALTGLQFVVIALVSEQGAVRGLGEVNAFGTPTVVHFCAVLLLSAIVSAPWPRVAQAGVLLTLCGIAGLIYVGIVLRRALRQTGYKPVFEDWLWHTILPFAAYGGLTAGGILVATHPTPALFTMATVALVLLFDGIHNAWDTVTYVAMSRAREGSDKPPRTRP